MQAAAAKAKQDATFQAAKEAAQAAAKRLNPAQAQPLPLPPPPPKVPLLLAIVWGGAIVNGQAHAALY